MTFADKFGIEFHNDLKFQPPPLDMVTLHDVLEHLDDSPRELLNQLLGWVRLGGYLSVTVPNAANIRKRISAVLGRTIHPIAVKPANWTPREARVGKDYFKLLEPSTTYRYRARTSRVAR